MGLPYPYFSDVCNAIINLNDTLKITNKQTIETKTSNCMNLENIRKYPYDKKIFDCINDGISNPYSTLCAFKQCIDPSKKCK
jgi:hypothetical protein